jgi:hypothetical protein
MESSLVNSLSPVRGGMYLNSMLSEYIALLTELETFAVPVFYKHFAPNGARIKSLRQTARSSPAASGKRYYGIHINGKDLRNRNQCRAQPFIRVTDRKIEFRFNVADRGPQFSEIKELVIQQV